MKEKLYRFMVGRNGNDELNRFLLLVCVIVMLPGPYLLSHVFEEPAEARGGKRPLSDAARKNPQPVSCQKGTVGSAQGIQILCLSCMQDNPARAEGKGQNQDCLPKVRQLVPGKKLNVWLSHGRARISYSGGRRTLPCGVLRTVSQFATALRTAVGADAEL